MFVNTLLDYENDPEKLELLYKEQPDKFELDLSGALNQKPDSITFRVWATRLNIKLPQKENTSPTLITVITLSVFAGLVAKVPAFFLNENWFYPRFAPFVALMATAIYFLYVINVGYLKRLVGIFCLITIIYLSLLPDWSTSSSVTMALIHLPLACWIITGIVFSKGKWQEKESRIKFISYSGELIILSSLILIGGAVLTGMTIALFQVIGIELEDKFIETILPIGAAATPVVGTYIYDVVLQRKMKLASTLSKVFAPLFLVLLFAFIVTAAVQGLPFLYDRDYLIIFNALLLVILCISLFSLTDQDQLKEKSLLRRTSISLITATVVVDLMALYAISFRLFEYGFSLNRFYVLTINILILGHLMYLLFPYVNSIRNGHRTRDMTDAVVNYFPVYATWIVLATFLLPFVFSFK